METPSEDENLEQRLNENEEENEEENYDFLDSDAQHIPGKTLPHRPNTCFISASTLLLEIALSYVPESIMTNDENNLYRLLKNARTGDEETQRVFLNNMQCLTMNPILALNRRNKSIIFRNESLDPNFYLGQTLRELKDYNLIALTRWGCPIRGERNDRSREIIDNLSRSINDRYARMMTDRYFVLIGYMTFYAIHEGHDALIPEGQNYRIYYSEPDDDVLDTLEDLWHGFLKRATLPTLPSTASDAYAMTAVSMLMDGFDASPRYVIAEVFRRIHEFIQTTNDAFVEALKQCDWSDAPYIYDLAAYLDPDRIKVHAGRTPTEPIEITVFSNITNKVVPVHDFIKRIGYDVNVKFPYNFDRKIMVQHGFQELLRLGDYKPLFELSHLNYAYDAKRKLNEREMAECQIHPSFVSRRATENELKDFCTTVALVAQSGGHWSVYARLTDNTRNGIENGNVILLDDIDKNHYHEVRFPDSSYNGEIQSYNVAVMKSKRYSMKFPRTERMKWRMDLRDPNQTFCLVIPKTTAQKYKLKFLGGSLARFLLILTLVVVLIVVIITALKSLFSQPFYFDYS